ncbi:MAG: arylesterase [Arenimonas sp.]|nr:arylesterase [Arenimonas sp.]MBP6626927.1 arylesterase [Arenimonas sp.]
MALLLALALPAALASAAAPRTVLVLGDSLSAAYGIEPEQGWVALVASRVQAEHAGWQVVNASVSGETTAGGASRIAGELARHRPEVVVIELGANDGLRGLPLDQARANLDRMILAAKASGARVLLLGMRLPPNFGPQYTQQFEQNFLTLASQHEVALLPFLLEPIATERDSFQADSIHPVAAVQPRLRDHVWPALEPLLR